MTVDLSLNRSLARVGLVLSALAISLLVLWSIITLFVKGTLSDLRVSIDRSTLSASLRYFSSSASLHGRLAETELLEEQRDMSVALHHANMAVGLSPNSYRYRLILAAAQEAAGDRESAEETMRRAVALAPNNTNVRWRLANLLLRREKLDEALGEFRRVTNSQYVLLPATMDLVWRASGERIDALEAVLNDDAADRVTLAQFLLEQSRVEDAILAFRSVAPVELRSVPGTSSFIRSVVSSGDLETARELWTQVVGGSNDRLIWNGGFENDIIREFAHFDWNIGASEYARIRIDRGTSRGGDRSLRVDFLGRDTTRLANEIRQLLVLKPGARYRIECFVMRRDLITPEGPRIVVTEQGTGKLLGQSKAINPGVQEWEPIEFDFTAPAGSGNAVGVLLSVQRRPQFAYDDPTRGTLWFDDFSITETTTSVAGLRAEN